MKARVAAFDFDGTVTVRDTILPFLLEVSGFREFVARLPRALPTLLVHGLGFLDSRRTKEALFRIYLRGRRRSDVEAAATRFARDGIPKLLRTSAVQRLRWHQSRGDRCLIVTASPEIYVAPWASEMGLETIGSRLEVDENDLLTGSHEGPVCNGAEKVRRLRERIGAESCELYAYGDSSGDSELLAAATHSYLGMIPTRKNNETSPLG